MRLVLSTLQPPLKFTYSSSRTDQKYIATYLSSASSQGSAMAKQLGAEAYLECSAFTSEKSIHSVFRTAALACVNKLQPLAKSSPNRRLSKRLLHLPSRSELLSSTFKKEKAKSCSVM